MHCGSKWLCIRRLWFSVTWSLEIAAWKALSVASRPSVLRWTLTFLFFLGVNLQFFTWAHTKCWFCSAAEKEEVYPSLPSSGKLHCREAVYRLIGGLRSSMVGLVQLVHATHTHSTGLLQALGKGGGIACNFSCRRDSKPPVTLSFFFLKSFLCNVSTGGRAMK